MFTHYPWHGIELLHEMALLVRQRTQKTRCGKRAPIGRTTSLRGAVDCPACRAGITADLRERRSLLRSIRELERTRER